MRVFLLFIVCLLCGCASGTDPGGSFVSSVNAFNAAFGSQDNLELDLMKDFVRKSDQLSFISGESYSCGDPNDRYIISLEQNYSDFVSRTYDNPKKYEVLIKAQNDARAKNALLIAVSEYGKTISGIVTDFATTKAGIAASKSVVASLKGSGGLTEAALVLGALEAVLNIVDAATDESKVWAISQAALKMQKPLAETVAKVKERQSLVSLSLPEAQAFSYWNRCARERLNFMRMYYPAAYSRDPKKRDEIARRLLSGETRSSVIDFAREYAQYTTEREAFIARRPNYSALLDAIVTENMNILTATPEGVFGAATRLGNLTGVIIKNTDALKKPTSS